MALTRPFLGLLIGVIAVTTTYHGAAQVAVPPNFVIVFVDDLGYGDLGAFGFPEHPPPPDAHRQLEELRATRSCQ